MKSWELNALTFGTIFLIFRKMSTRILLTRFHYTLNLAQSTSIHWQHRPGTSAVPRASIYRGRIFVVDVYPDSGVQSNRPHFSSAPSPLDCFGAPWNTVMYKTIIYWERDCSIRQARLSMLPGHCRVPYIVCNISYLTVNKGTCQKYYCAEMFSPRIYFPFSAAEGKWNYFKHFHHCFIINHTQFSEVGKRSKN